MDNIISTITQSCANCLKKVDPISSVYTISANTSSSFLSLGSKNNPKDNDVVTTKLLWGGRKGKGRGRDGEGEERDGELERIGRHQTVGFLL